MHCDKRLFQREKLSGDGFKVCTAQMLMFYLLLSY